MARQKIKEGTIDAIVSEHSRGETPANLAIKYGVHPTTIRRYLRDKGLELSQVSYPTLLDKKVKIELRKLLTQYTDINVDKLISDLDKNFIITERPKEDEFKIIQLGGKDI